MPAVALVCIHAVWYHARMSTEVKMAELPDCDIHKSQNQTVTAAYDGKTVHGPWAYMCESCWLLHGVGRLGTGYGQRLILAQPEQKRAQD